MKPPTIKDIAKLAKVSVATVSFVLNNLDYKITPETKERVLQAAKELHYQPNAIAQSLRTNRSGIIGLIIPSITNPFYPAIARGVEDAAEAAGYTVFLCNSYNNLVREEKYIQVLLQKRVDGIIIASNLIENADYTKLIENTPARIVSFARNNRLKNVDFLLVDHIYGGYIATTHLLELGHTKVAYIGRRMKRLKGFENAFAERGLTVDQELIVTTYKNVNGLTGEDYINMGYSVTGKLLSDRPDVTAIVTNDLSALGAMKAIKEKGLKIPDDISIIGYDDNPFAATTDPPLTTVEQPKYERGKDAVEILLSRIGDSRVRTTEIMYEPKLILRSSTGPV